MATINTPKDLVDWYENQERVLTPAFLETIAWRDISNHEIDPSSFPILVYFRDVEKFTN